MEDSPGSLVGERVGHIRLTGIIGQGGMGTVYSGFDEKLQRKVAVKTIHGQFRLSQETKARFLREARILSQINHPATCTIHDYIEADENDYLVMELVEGVNLRELLSRGLEERQKASITEQLLEVLVAVHAKGVIHRDLKPENIMVQPGGQIKVLDFGLSRSVGEPHSSFPTLGIGESSEMYPVDPVRVGDSVYVKTRQGAILGTAAYMSPEQARGEQASPASDVYSLGLILQEMFTGKRGFEDGLSPSELLRKAGRAETRSAEGLSADLAGLIERMKSLAPGARPSTIDALAIFRAIQERPKLQRRRILAAVAGLVLLAFVSAVVVQSLRATGAAKEAERQAVIAMEISDFMLGVFERFTPMEGGGETVRVVDVLEQGAREAEQRLSSSPLVKARVLAQLGYVFLGLNLPDKARPLFERAVEIFDDNLAADFDDIDSALTGLASSTSSPSKDRLKLDQRRLSLLEKNLGLQHPKTVTCLLLLMSEFEYVLPDASDEVDGLWASVVGVDERRWGEEDPEIITPLFNLAYELDRRGHHDRAERARKQAMNTFANTVDIADPEHWELVGFYADDLSANGRASDAEALFRRQVELSEALVGKTRFPRARALSDLARFYYWHGRYSEAEPLFLESRDIYADVFGENSLYVAITDNELANLYQRLGMKSEAEDRYLKAILAYEKLGDRPPSQITDALMSAALIRLIDGRHEEARSLLDRSWEQQVQRDPDEGNPGVLPVSWVLMDAARECLGKGLCLSAETAIEYLIRECDRYKGSVYDAYAREALGEALLLAGWIRECLADHTGAVTYWKQSVELTGEQKRSSDSPRIIRAHYLGLALLGRTDDAQLVARQHPDLELEGIDVSEGAVNLPASKPGL